MKLIFVCTGNTCRSPLAESIARAKMPALQVESRGLFTVDGTPNATHVTQIVKTFELPEPTTAQQFTEEDLSADVILTMTNQHKAFIISQFGTQQNVYTLHEYIEQRGEVQDPFGGSYDNYIHIYHELEGLISQLQRKISK